MKQKKALLLGTPSILVKFNRMNISSAQKYNSPSLSAPSILALLPPPKRLPSFRQWHLLIRPQYSSGDCPVSPCSLCDISIYADMVLQKLLYLFFHISSIIIYRYRSYKVVHCRYTPQYCCPPYGLWLQCMGRLSV